MGSKINTNIKKPLELNLYGDEDNVEDGAEGTPKRPRQDVYGQEESDEGSNDNFTSVSSMKRFRSRQKDDEELQASLKILEQEKQELLLLMENWASKRDRFSVERRKTFMTHLNKIMEHVRWLALEKTNAVGRVRQSNYDMNKFCSGLQGRGVGPVPGPGARGAAAPQPIINKNNDVKTAKPSFALVLKTSSAKSSDDVEQLLKQTVKPEEKGLKVRRLRKAKDKAVVVNFDSEADLNSFKENLKESKDFTVVEAKRRSPKLSIYNVPSDLSPDEIKKGLLALNGVILNKNFVTMDILKNDCTFKFKTGKRRPGFCTWVVEVTPGLRNKLLKIKELHIGWGTCSIRDFLSVSRCFKCQGLYHIAKDCREKVDTCNHCAETGHTHKTCPNKSKQRTCALCKRASLPCEHLAKKCPSLRRALEALVRSTDYGDDGSGACSYFS